MFFKNKKKKVEPSKKDSAFEWDTRTYEQKARDDAPKGAKLKDGVLDFYKTLKPDEDWTQKLRTFGNPNQVDSLTGYSLLYLACNDSRMDLVKVLVEQGANINQELVTMPGSFNNPAIALQPVCSNGNESLFDYLIEQGADSFVMQDKIDLMRSAFRYDHLGIIEKLKSLGHTLDPNKTDKYNRTLLFDACGSGLLSQVKFLVEQGADIHHRDKHGDQPMDLAVKRGKSLEVMEYLFACGYKMAKEDGSRLLFSILSNRYQVMSDEDVQYGIKVMDFLLEKGVDINQAYQRSEFLFEAVKSTNHIGFIRHAVELGADYTQLNDSGENLLHAACGKADLTPELLAYLLNLGLEVNTRDRSGSTPIANYLYALKDEEIDVEQAMAILQLIMEHGGDPYLGKCGDEHAYELLDRVCRYHESFNRKRWDVRKILDAFHDAYEEKNLSEMKRLLDTGYSMYARNHVENTVPEMVVKRKDFQMIDTLLEWGLDLNLPFGEYHRSVLEFASRRDDKEMYNYLMGISSKNLKKAEAPKEEKVEEETATDHSGIQSLKQELEKFKMLLDEGLITQEEYKEKRKQVLGL